MEGVTTHKQMKPVVTRCVAVHDRKTNGGTRRSVVIYYELNRTTNTLTYGATVFKPENPKQRFNYASHAETAKKRFNDHPIVLSGVKDDNSLGDFNKYVRKFLFTYGCRSRTIDV